MYYLINMSVIWLVALIGYQLFFRKETFHQANRFYLLCSLLLGLCLPAVNIQERVPTTTIAMMPPVQRVYDVKEYVAKAATPESSNISAVKGNGEKVSLLLWVIYLFGFVIGLYRVLKEGVHLYRLYRQGKKRFHRNYTLVETGQPFTPFSFGRNIFVSGEGDYKAEQWGQLIAHEQEHARQLHFIDNLLLITLRLVFWFHPLPYIYFRHLRMIHEYQADEVAATNVPEYGAFLLQQTLQQSSILTHAFHYSPIKNRIIMLTKDRSTRLRSIKYLTTIPIVMLFILCCSKISLSGEVSAGNKKVYFRGNEVAFGKLKIIPFAYREEFERQKKMFVHASLPDSVPVKDVRTGFMKMEAVTYALMPVSLNGRPVLGNEPEYLLADADRNYSAPVFGDAENLEALLFSKLQSKLNELGDGIYNFNVDRLVLDDKGRIAYYEAKGISAYNSPYEAERVLDRQLKSAIDQEIVKLLGATENYKPAMKDGVPVNVRLRLGAYEILVKNHQAKLIERKGC